MFIHLLSLGRVPYAEALAIQQRVIAARKANRIADTPLLEHPRVLTLGRDSRCVRRGFAAEPDPYFLQPVPPTAGSIISLCRL